VKESIRSLVDRSFESTRRHGKYLFVELEGREWMSMHFNMTGDLKYYKNTDEEPDYEQVLFHFQNGYRLAYVVPCKLGEIQLINSVDDFWEEKELVLMYSTFVFLFLDRIVYCHLSIPLSHVKVYT
jgi:formamidopyrimidine-DNA glycosylase